MRSVGVGAAAALVVHALAGLALVAGLALPVVGAGAVAALAVSIAGVAASAGHGGAREPAPAGATPVALPAVGREGDQGHIQAVGVVPLVGLPVGVAAWMSH